MRALFSGVTGIRSHQTRMDVIGNNIANVNTTGFKSSRVTFVDVFSQTLNSGTEQVSPLQVGLGVAVGSTELNQATGSFQLTGRDLDLAIEGQGMFILKQKDGQRVFSRAGNFDWDSDGTLVNPGNGQRVQGWMADAAGAFNTDPTRLTNIVLNKGDVSLAQATNAVTVGQNLDAGAAASASYDTAFTAYDSLGRSQAFTVRFTKDAAAANTWAWSYQTPDSAAGVWTAGGSLVFNTGGALSSGGSGSIAYTPTGAAAMAVSVNFNSITQAYAGSNGSTAIVRDVNGSPMGVLETVATDASGVVTGVYSNGTRRSLAQVALATFNNPSGLFKVGASSFSESPASGAAIVAGPGKGGMGKLATGNLEMSNVDISSEFTNMIVTQRGFQANTRIISTSDDMVLELVNLRR